MRHLLLLVIAIVFAATKTVAFAPDVSSATTRSTTILDRMRMDTTTSTTRLALFWGKSSNDSKEKKEKKGADTSKEDEKKGFPFVMLLGRPQHNWTTGTKSYTNSQRQNWLNPKKKNPK